MSVHYKFTKKEIEKILESLYNIKNTVRVMIPIEEITKETMLSDLYLKKLTWRHKIKHTKKPWMISIDGLIKYFEHYKSKVDIPKGYVDVGVVKSCPELIDCYEYYCNKGMIKRIKKGFNTFFYNYKDVLDTVAYIRKRDNIAKELNIVLGRPRKR